MLSGPKVYYSAVRAAISQYECASSAEEIVARQEFDFKVE
jgi:periplasmic protein TonB